MNPASVMKLFTTWAGLQMLGPEHVWRTRVYADGKLEERAVKTGLANWEYTEVSDGLKPGERIVTSLERAGVKSGARVVPDEKSAVR